MANIFNDLKDKYLNILKPVQQTLGNVGQATQQFTQPARDLANRGGLINQIAPRTTANVNNFLSQNIGMTQGRYNPVAQFKAATQLPQQQALQYRQQVDQLVPRLNVAQNVQNPYLRFGAEMGQGLINTFPNAIAGAAKLPAARNFQQGAADVASIAEAPLSLTGFGVAKNIGLQGLKQAGFQGLKQTVKQGAKTGAVYGGIFGGTAGLREGEYDSLGGQLGKTALGIGTGAALGGVTGGALSGGGYIVGGVINLLTKKHGFNPKQARDEIGRFIKEEAKRIARGGKPPKGEPVYYGDIRESLGLPRNGDYQLPQPGLSIKYTKNPLQPLAEEARGIQQKINELAEIVQNGFDKSTGAFKDKQAFNAFKERQFLLSKLRDLETKITDDSNKIKDIERQKKDAKLRALDSSVDSLDQISIKELISEAKKYSTFDEFRAKMRGSSTQYGEYSPRLRKYVKPESVVLGDIKGLNPDTVITVYRGIDAKNVTGKSIRNGDFVTTDYNDALQYTDSPSKVVSLRAKLKNFIAEYPDEVDISDPQNPVSYELIYNRGEKINKITDSKLSEIYNQSKLSPSELEGGGGRLQPLAEEARKYNMPMGKKITLYHGSNKTLSKDKLDYGTFFTKSEQEAIDYANMRSGGRGGKPVISKFELDPSEVRLSEGTGEYQYIGKSQSILGKKYPPEIYRAVNDYYASNMSALEIDKMTFNEVRDTASNSLKGGGGKAEFDKLLNSWSTTSGANKSRFTPKRVGLSPSDTTLGTQPQTGMGSNIINTPHKPIIPFSPLEGGGGRLAEEARKYKSAEEFVKAQLSQEPTVTVYRGSKTGKVHSDIKDFTFFATNKEYAKQYITKGEKLVEYKLPESALLRDKVNTQEVQYLVDTRNPKISQLTDIYNQSQLSTGSLRATDATGLGSSSVGLNKDKISITGPTSKGIGVSNGTKDIMTNPTISRNFRLKSHNPIIPYASPLEGGVKGLEAKGTELSRSGGGVKGEIAKNIVKPIEQIQKEVQQVAGNTPKIPVTNLSKPQTPVLKESGISGGGSGKSLQNQSSKYVYNINKNRLQLNPSEKQTLDTVVNAVKPELQNIKGKTLSNDEVIKAAKTSDILQKVTNREETLAAEAATLKARQRLVELDKNIGQLAKGGNTPQLQAQMKDLIDSLRVVSANAADTGRKLQSLSIEAGDESIRMQVLKDVAKTSNNTDEILKAAQAVNWEDARSITKFYRQFIKPTTMEVLDEFRYNNMLSNPKTHLRNNFSNIIQTFVTRPATILAEGRPVEAAKYLSGAVKGFPEAIQAFKNSFSGKVAMTKPDLEQIATGKLPQFLTIPTRLMEASDKFFSALIKGGEIARGKTPEQAAKMAEYSLFRQGLKPEGQGTVLNAIDNVTAWTYNAPKAVRWFVPFIRTPMNFAKQWIEYSPAGITTLKGAGNKREQLAKTILGTMVTAVGANLAMDNKTTWAAPSDPKEKELFYAAGKKPFSILIGDKWVPMMYAGPFAFALALPAASKFYQEDNRTALTDDGITKLTKTASSMAQFISGQTFLEGIGNFVKFATGDADYSIGSNLAFTAGQVVPMQGLLRYISTIMDPIYRKPKGFGESFMKDIPGFSQNLQAYTEPTGEPSTRLPVNYITPYDIGQRKPEYEQGLQERQSKLQENAVINQATKQVEQTKTPQEIAGNYIYYDPDTQTTKKISLNLTVPKPELTGLAELDKQKVSAYNSKVTATIKKISTLAELGYFSPQEAEQKIIELKQVQKKATGTIKVTKAKKAKKITIPKVKAIKLKIPKSKTIKVKSVKPKRIKVYKLSKVKKLSTKVPKITLT